MRRADLRRSDSLHVHSPCDPSLKKVSFLRDPRREQATMIDRLGNPVTVLPAYADPKAWFSSRRLEPRKDLAGLGQLYRNAGRDSDQLRRDEFQWQPSGYGGSARTPIHRNRNGVCARQPVSIPRLQNFHRSRTRNESHYEIEQHADSPNRKHSEYRKLVGLDQNSNCMDSDEEFSSGFHEPRSWNRSSSENQVNSLVAHFNERARHKLLPERSRARERSWEEALPSASVYPTQDRMLNGNRPFSYLSSESSLWSCSRDPRPELVAGGRRVPGHAPRRSPGFASSSSKENRESSRLGAFLDSRGSNSESDEEEEEEFGEPIRRSFAGSAATLPGRGSSHTQVRALRENAILRPPPTTLLGASNVLPDSLKVLSDVRYSRERGSAHVFRGCSSSPRRNRTSSPGWKEEAAARYVVDAQPPTGNVGHASDSNDSAASFGERQRAREQRATRLLHASTSSEKGRPGESAPSRSRGSPGSSRQHAGAPPSRIAEKPKRIRVVFDPKPARSVTPDHSESPEEKRVDYSRDSRKATHPPGGVQSSSDASSKHLGKPAGRTKHFSLSDLFRRSATKERKLDDAQRKISSSKRVQGTDHLLEREKESKEKGESKSPHVSIMKPKRSHSTAAYDRKLESSDATAISSSETDDRHKIRNQTKLTRSTSSLAKLNGIRYVQKSYHSAPTSYNSSESDASHFSHNSNSSNRSVFSYAPAVADIPAPSSSMKSARSKPDLSEIPKGRHVVTRSMSLLAPWKPKHLRDAYEVDYSSQNDLNQMSSRPPRPPRRKHGKSKSP